MQTALVNGAGWAPDYFRDGDTNVQQEKTYAGFGLLRFGGELGSKTLDGNIGVRVVQTDYTAAGSVRQPDWINHPLLNNNGDPDFVAKWGTGAWLPNSFDDSYQDVLPSLNLRLKLTAELQLRLGGVEGHRASEPGSAHRQSLARRRHPHDLPAAGSERPERTAGAGRRSVTSFTGSGGNPLLKPMEANQFDAALEWYFAPQGSLYTTLFYKDLKNYFMRAASAEPVRSRLGGRYHDQWRQGHRQGLRDRLLAVLRWLPGWLSGLGMQANFTYVDSKGGSPTAGPSGDSATVPPGLPLEGLSKTSYNAIGLYQRGPVEARLAYNWRERWLLTTHDGDGKGSVWNDDYGQLDASVFVRFNEHLQVGLEGNNLTNTTQKLLVGPYRYTLAADSNTPATT